MKLLNFLLNSFLIAIDDVTIVLLPRPKTAFSWEEDRTLGQRNKDDLQPRIHLSNSVTCFRKELLLLNYWNSHIKCCHNIPFTFRILSLRQVISKNLNKSESFAHSPLDHLYFCHTQHNKCWVARHDHCFHWLSSDRFSLQQFRSWGARNELPLCHNSVILDKNQLRIMRSWLNCSTPF